MLADGLRIIAKTLNRDEAFQYVGANQKAWVMVKCTKEIDGK